MGKNVSYFKTKTNIKHNWRNIGVSNKPDWGGRSYVGRRIEWGDHFLPNKFIERSFECWANSTKQLLNIGGEHQPPRKAAHSLPKEVGQNIKDKKRDKRVRDRDLSWGGSRERGEVSNTRIPSHRWLCGELWNVRGQHNWEEKNKKINPTAYVPNSNSQQRSSPEARIHHQWAGAEEGGEGCIP